MKALRVSTSFPLVLFFLWCAIMLAQTAAVDPLAPTHNTKSAAELDHEWQVSVSKYDGARAALLREVERQDNDGPYVQTQNLAGGF